MPGTMQFRREFGRCRSRSTTRKRRQSEKDFRRVSMRPMDAQQQASRSRNGPVRAGPDAQTAAQAALDRKRKRSRKDSRHAGGRRRQTALVHQTADRKSLLSTHRNTSLLDHRRHVQMKSSSHPQPRWQALPQSRTALEESDARSVPKQSCQAVSPPDPRLGLPWRLSPSRQGPLWRCARRFPETAER